MLAIFVHSRITCVKCRHH